MEFIGLRRLTQEQALAVSGLQTGDPFSEAAIDDAAKKLVDSGLFARLGFRVKSSGGDQVTVTFQVEEAERTTQIVFDNFVWFSEEELFTAIRRDLPFFNGTVPESGAAADAIAKALQRLLDEKKIPGRIEHLPEENYVSGGSYHLFSVKGIALPVCALHFPGAAAITEDELRKASKQLTESDYSKSSTATFASVVLFPLYRHVGRLRAKFDEASAALLTPDSPACKEGLSVTIPVEEGAVYSWEKAEWSGNQSVSAEELDAALGMKSGEVADGLKIDKGLQSVAKAFGHKGYLDVRMKRTPYFEETNHRVRYQFSITEGPQYHMGNLTIAGLGHDEAEQVKKVWALAPGAVYDAAYVEDFWKKGGGEVFTDIFKSRIAREQPPPRIDIAGKPDRQNQTVNVIITVK